MHNFELNLEEVLRPCCEGLNSHFEVWDGAARRYIYFIGTRYGMQAAHEQHLHYATSTTCTPYYYILTQAPVKR